MIDVNVQRAAAYLDYFHPGWFYQVDPERLAMHSCARCVLWQVFGCSEFGSEWHHQILSIFGPPDLSSPGLIQPVSWDRPETSPVGFSIEVFRARHFARYWVTAIRQRIAAAQASTTAEPAEALLVS